MPTDNHINATTFNQSNKSNNSTIAKTTTTSKQIDFNNQQKTTNITAAAAPVKLFTSTTTTTTTTTTPKPKPKKPLITKSVGEFPELIDILKSSSSNNNNNNNNDNKIQDDFSAPIPPEPEAVRDPSATASMHTDMFVPFLTIMFTIPLVAGIIITTYRRFRDCWTTRHYRRMDFLVDGMYND